MSKQTPRFVGRNAIRLSGADQVILLLKYWSGGWLKYLKWEQHLDEVHRKEGRDLNHAKLIQEFERKHNINIIIRGNHIVGYKHKERD